MIKTFSNFMVQSCVAGLFALMVLVPTANAATEKEGLVKFFFIKPPICTEEENPICLAVIVPGCGQFAIRPLGKSSDTRRITIKSERNLTLKEGRYQIALRKEIECSLKSKPLPEDAVIKAEFTVRRGRITQVGLHLKQGN